MKKRMHLLIYRIFVIFYVLFTEQKRILTALLSASYIKKAGKRLKHAVFFWFGLESGLVQGMSERISCYFSGNIGKKLVKNIQVLALPLLSGLFPLFFLFAQNAREMMINNLLAPACIVILFSVSFTFVSGFAVRNFKKSSLAASLLLFSFFSYGHITRLLPAFHITLANSEFGTSQILIIPFLALIGFLLVRIFRTRLNLFPAIKILSSVGIMLLVFQIVQAGFIISTRTNAGVQTEVSDRNGTEKKSAKNTTGRKTDPKKNTAVKVSQKKKNDSRLPDIYYIVVDAYGRSDILKEIYGVDNSGFIRFLKDKGFYVPEMPHSHYCQTIFSLSAILNMNYISTLGDFDPGMTDRIPVAQKLKRNKVMNLLKKEGYTTVAFATGYENTEVESADVFLKPSGVMSEFENVLMTTTMLPASQTGEDSQFASHRKRINYILNKIPGINEARKPKFVFAHIVCPHPPFVFDKDGRPVQQGDFFHMGDGSHFTNSDQVSVSNYISGYAGQVAYLTNRLKQMIGKLLDQYSNDNKPIIILQGDHGPGSGLNWESLDGTNIKERFGILHAYYLPGNANKPAYDNISPINMFRTIFNVYLNGNYEILPSRSYFTLWGAPYNFQDVTERLIRESKNEPQISSNR